MFFMMPFLFSLFTSQVMLLDNFRLQSKPMNNTSCDIQNETVLDIYSITRLSMNNNDL
jgi:hypothetical protein